MTRLAEASAIGPGLGEMVIMMSGRHGGEQVVGKGHDLPDRHAAMDGLQPASPDDDDHADVDEDGQGRRHGGHETHHPDRVLGEILVGGLEALAFEIGAHKGFDQARPGDVLLQDGVEPVQLLLDGAEERFHLDD